MLNDAFIIAFGSGGGGGTLAVNTTYSELKAKRDAGELTPGAFYRITDYVTKIIGYYDLSALGASGYLHFGKSAEHPYDIIVQAVDASTLSEVARAALHEGDTYFASANIDAWELKYCLDNDTTRFSFADATNGKGVVYWMKDEWGNEAWYDFKNVLALRYALKLQDATAGYTPKNGGLVYNDDENAGALQYNRYGDTYRIFTALKTYLQSGTYVCPFNFDGKNYGDYDFAVGYNILGVTQATQIDDTYLQTFAADLYYTFDFYDPDNGHIDASLNATAKVPCQENKIAFCSDILSVAFLQVGNVQGLSYNVFEVNKAFVDGASRIVGCNGNCYEENCNNNTFGCDAVNECFGTGCYSNTFGDNCYWNTFGNDCNSNTFGDNCNSNTFGDSCYANTFGTNCQYNTFGVYCYSNTFGDTCFYNTFGSYDANNELQGNIYGAIFENECNDNTIDEIGNNEVLHDLHVDGYTNNISVPSAQLSATGKYELHSYGTAQEAVLVHKTGYNTETAVSTTDGGTTWTSVPATITYTIQS